MFLLQKSSSKASSRRQININGVKDSVLMLPNNEYRAVLRLSSINFELKSEEEQDALIENYQSFLNSLSCPLQIIVRIRELDMDKYLSDLESWLLDEKEEIYRAQIQNYSSFIQSLVNDNKILTRNFYIIVPHSIKDRNVFELVKQQLNLSCDIVAKGLLRLDIQSRRLNSLEILDLFYSFYNPYQAKSQPITNQTLQLLHSVYVRKDERV
jgi:hypothetical protein